MRALELTGQRIGRLTVIGPAPAIKKGRRWWVCKCDCGQKTTLTSGQLNGRQPTRSCGCLRDDSLRERVTIHGKSHTGPYYVWQAMIQRCTNPNNDHWDVYGGRGITVCDRWRDYNNFALDMGECPPGHHIDRIDSNGNYEPSNCRWQDNRLMHSNRRADLRNDKIAIRYREEREKGLRPGHAEELLAAEFGVSKTVVRLASWRRQGSI